MTTLSRRALGFLLLLSALSAAGCSKPEPPRILPRAARVVGVTPTELRLGVELDVYNPNSFPLLVRSATGELGVGSGGGTAVGAAHATLTGSIPAKASSIVQTELAVSFTNLPALTSLALTAPTVPYTFRGSANVGGERFNADVPFTLTGELTRAELLQAGLRGLSGAGVLGVPAP